MRTNTEPRASDGSGGLPGPGLARLLTLFSPAFPIGAFAWSHGLEAAIAEGRLADGPGVEAWIAFLLARGSGRTDLVLMAEAHRAARTGDAPRLGAVTALATALAGGAERRAETLALGAAFVEASRPWGEGLFEPGEAPAYPVAVGRLGAHLSLALPDTALGLAHGFAANLVSAALRLVPLAQSRSVVVLRNLEGPIEAAARFAARSTLDDLGSASLVSDIAALRHEALETRLFRS
ncbi:urease accessory protein UreF [Aurantimonas sp. Leaf443]|nr:urease accessory protein UreF [Aurantimonas sp. Leaf443]